MPATTPRPRSWAAALMHRAFAGVFPLCGRLRLIGILPGSRHHPRNARRPRPVPVGVERVLPHRISAPTRPEFIAGGRTLEKLPGSKPSACHLLLAWWSASILLSRARRFGRREGVCERCTTSNPASADT